MWTALWWVLFALANANFDKVRYAYLGVGVFLIGFNATIAWAARQLDDGDPNKRTIILLYIGFFLSAWILPPVTLFIRGSNGG